MYAKIVAAASFWSQLVEIDLQFQRDVIARGCPRCGGPLHVADHPRKPRGVPDEFASDWSKRCNTCCGRCRRRCLPPSVRFLGRKVYAAAIVILATMHALVCGATRRTHGRWTAWWTQVVPTTAWWRQVRALLARPVDCALLPGMLLERYEPEPGVHSAEALVGMMVAMGPLTTNATVLTFGEGRTILGELTHKMRSDSKRRGLLPESRAPTRPT
jgi:hypothetical protein